MINNVTLVGRLTKDIDLRYTGNGTAVGNFNLAVNRPFKTQSGEQEADFIRCVVWRKAAENMANYTSKGSLVGITGRIQTRSYDDKDGKRVYITEVVCENVQYLDTKSNSNEGSNSQQGDYSQNTQNGSQGNYGANNNSYPERDSSEPVDVNDDDLPF